MDQERLTKLLGPESAALARETMDGWNGVPIDRARFERLRAIAELAHEWINAPEGTNDGQRALDAMSYAADALQPGDLDPIP